MDAHVARMREMRIARNILVGKPEGKRPLGRLRCRWEDNIRMNLRVMGRGRGVNWKHTHKDTDWLAFVNTVSNLWVP
jgi:hypothetical protein